ncbi:helix-turn-helix domain-containing protein [Nocardia cyriacigeorgica]|uniref:helix-turn-helix domain-containing protein n=1 Tax=Nocardia cyriacigeorgica TaxID=135487 RepID=UPI003CC7E4FD
MTEKTPKFSKLAWLKNLAGADLTDGEYRVLVTIFNYSDGSGRRSYAGQSRLSEDTGKSDRQIRRIIPELIRKGWLTEVRKGSGRSGMASEFQLRTPDIDGKNTGHIGYEYRTFEVETPVTGVLPTDPNQIQRTDPNNKRGSNDPSDGYHAKDTREEVSNLSPSGVGPFPVVTRETGSPIGSSGEPSEPSPLEVPTMGNTSGSSARPCGASLYASCKKDLFVDDYECVTHDAESSRVIDDYSTREGYRSPSRHRPKCFSSSCRDSDCDVHGGFSNIVPF